MSETTREKGPTPPIKGLGRVVAAVLVAGATAFGSGLPERSANAQELPSGAPTDVIPKRDVQALISSVENYGGQIVDNLSHKDLVFLAQKRQTAIQQLMERAPADAVISFLRGEDNTNARNRLEASLNSDDQVSDFNKTAWVERDFQNLTGRLLVVMPASDQEPDQDNSITLLDFQLDKPTPEGYQGLAVIIKDPVVFFASYGREKTYLLEEGVSIGSLALPKSTPVEFNPSPA